MRLPLTNLVLFSMLFAAALPVPARQKWELQQHSNLLSPRAGHQVVRLADDSVLVIGGCSDEGCRPILASSEILDVRRGSVRVGSSMSVARISHAVTQLKGGDALVVGGWTGSATTSVVDRFRISSQEFELAGKLRTARMDAIAIPLDDERILVAGGAARIGQALSSAEVMTLSTGTMQMTTPMHQARTSFAATRLKDGRVLLTGGLDGRRPLSTVEVFDPVSSSFRVLGSMSSARYKHAAVTLRDGRVLIVAGSSGGDERNRLASTEIFDPVNNTFTAGPSLLSPRFKIPASAAVLPSGDVVIAGGADDVEIWTPGESSFRRAAGTTGSSYEFASATTLSDGSVVVIGGYDSRIRPTAKTWRAAIVKN